METFYLILLIPVVVALIARWKFNHSINWLEAAAQIVIVSIVVSIVFFAGRYSQMYDTEIWNGEVTSKHRDQDYWLESYECNCITTCSGSGSNESCTTTCSTCYRDHYTVDWYLTSNIESKIQLKYLDWESKKVYKEPDPKSYKDAYVGEPCALEHGYTNYIKAVPESLFNPEDSNKIEQFADLIPSYPEVYGEYHVDRVLTMGMGGHLQLKKWNDYLGDKVKKLGPKKQVNVILVIVNTDNQMYRYALERAWLGGKKNDVIVILGVADYPKISWADTITLGQNAGNSLMTVTMRDDLMKIGTIEDYVPIIDTIGRVVDQKFDRKPMADYEYLKDSIEPPTWVVILAFVLSFVLSGILTWVFHVYDPFDIDYRRNYY